MCFLYLEMLIFQSPSKNIGRTSGYVFLKNVVGLKKNFSNYEKLCVLEIFLMNWQLIA